MSEITLQQLEKQFDALVEVLQKKQIVDDEATDHIYTDPQHAGTIKNGILSTPAMTKKAGNG